MQTHSLIISLIAVALTSTSLAECVAQTSVTYIKDASSAAANKQTLERIEGVWLETSCVVNGNPEPPTEYHSNLKNKNPIVVSWYLSRHYDTPRMTRFVQYGNTEIDDGNLQLGGCRIDTSQSPSWITFEYDGNAIGGIFKFEGNDLIIALPPREWNHEQKAYLVGKRPKSFETTSKNRKPWEVSMSDRVSVYRLTRPDVNMQNKAVKRSTQSRGK